VPGKERGGVPVRAEPEEDDPEDPLAREEAFVSRLISDFGATDVDEPEEGSLTSSAVSRTPSST